MAAQASCPDTVTSQAARWVTTAGRATACGKVILAGEHAVVYGKYALAVPLPLAMDVRVDPRTDGVQRVGVPAWDVPAQTLLEASPGPLRKCVALLVENLGLADRGFDLLATPHIPWGSGLGGSAALAVACIRAFCEAFARKIDDHGVNALAFKAEQIAHGTPSGIDNALATYQRPLLFSKAPKQLAPVSLGAPLHLVVGLTGKPGMTLGMVGAVAALNKKYPKPVGAIFDAINNVTIEAKAALEAGDHVTLGSLLDINHGLLCALGVSCEETEALVHIARQAGALGAKLTGGGGGGAMIAVCEDNADTIVAAMNRAGFDGYQVTVF